MADRYWVGGTGTWSAASTANWSDTSGGASGFSAPTAADNVFFDANSNVGTGAFTVTVSGALCNDFNVGSPTALDGAMTLAMGSSTLTVSGSWTNQATNFSVTNTSGTITFNATTTGKTITTNGVTTGVSMTLNGVGGAWTLGSALNIGSLNLTLTNGTFDTSTSNYAVTAGVFSSTNSNTRTINLNGSTISLSFSGWFMTTSTNATLNAGTSTISLSNSGCTFDGGSLTYYNVSFTSTTATGLTKVITGANTFNNLTFSTIASAGLNNITFDTNQTINGTFTVNGSNGSRRMFVRSNTMGTTRTLTCAAIAAMTDVDFRDITIAGAASPLSGTRLGDCGGNSNITFVAGKTVYWSLVGGGNWGATAWASGSGGTPADTDFPLPQDTAIIENTGLTAGNTITINGGFNISTLDASTRTNAMTLSSGANTPTFYGNFTYGSGVTPTGTGTYTFSNRATKTLNSGGKTFTQPITIDAPGGGIQLVTNNLTVDTARTTTLTRGTLDLNNLTLTTGLFSSTNSNTRTIAFGTGNITCTGTGTVWTTVTATNLSTTGTQVVNVTSAGSTAITVNPGVLSEADSISFNFTGGTYTLTWTSGAGGSARNLNFTGFAGTWTILNSSSIFGNLTLSTGMSLTPTGTATLSFAGTSGTQLITTNGKTLDFPVTFNGVGGTFRLQDAMTVGSTRTTTLTNGSLDLNSLTLSAGIFSSDNSNTRSIAFGSTGSIVTTTAGTFITVLAMATATNFTFTGTSNISAAMSVTRTFNFGGTAGATTSNRLNINLTSGASVPTFTGSFRQINFTGSTCNPGNVNISCHGFTLASGGTYTSTDFTTVGTGTLTSNGKVIDTLTVNGSGITTTLQDALTCGSSVTSTLTVGTLDLNNFTFTTGVFSSNNSNTRSIAFGSTGSIVLTTPFTSTLSMGTATNFTFTGTSNISAAMSNNRQFNFGGSGGATASNRLNINLTSGASTPTFIGSFRQINFTGSTSNPGAQTIFCHGFTLASGGFYYLSTDFTTVGDGTLTYTGNAINTLNINAAGITTTLADAGQNDKTTLTNGTLNLAGFTLTNTGSAATATGTKNLTFNGGTFVISDSGASAWNNAQPTNFTTTAGTGTGTISMTAATAKTFVGNGSTYNCTLNQGGAGTLTITGANTFNDITNTNATASQITFPASTTTTVNAFTLSGSSGNLVSLRSSVPGTRFTLSDPAGTVSVSFLDIQDSNATGGAIWQAFTSNGNVNSGNNLGWDFGSVTYNVSVSETATGSDAITLVLVRVGAVSETATGSDTTASQLTTSGAVSETATATDATTSQLTTSGAISETATGADTTATALTRVGAISEAVTGADTTATTLTRVGAVDETATGSDTTASQLDAVGAVSETATGADTAASQLTTSGAVSETATGADSLIATASLQLFVTEATTLADTDSGALVATAYVDEGALYSQVTTPLPVGTSFTGATIFNSSSAGGGLAVVANGTGTGSGGGFAAGGNYVLFSGANTRSITTIPLNLTSCPSFNFSIIRGNSSNGGETPEAGENIVVEYSINGGGSYTTIATILNTDPITTFTTLSYSMPVGAQTASTIIRWRQAASSQSAFDQYGIRNFLFSGGVLAADTAATALTRVGAVSETAEAVDTDAVTLTTVGAVDETATGTDDTTNQLDAFGGVDETATSADDLATQLDGLASIDELATAQDLPLGNIIATLQINEGATILDAALARLLWELINDNQLPGWQLIPNNQGSGWTIINTQAGGSWTNIDTV
jgi:hypothetical protein